MLLKESYCIWPQGQNAKGQVAWTNHLLEQSCNLIIGDWLDNLPPHAMCNNLSNLK